MTMQLLGLAVVAAVLYALLKQEQPSMAILFVVAVTLCLLSIFYRYMQMALEWIPVIQSGTEQLGFSCLLKAAGIILCADYGRDLCKDAGSESMANCISITGRIMVLMVALPLLENIYRSILELSQ